MNSIKVGWLIFTLLLMSVLGTGYHFYSEQTVQFRRHAANMHECKKLQEEHAQQMENMPETGEEEKEVLKMLAENKGKLWFLEDIEEQLGKKFSPAFLVIGPMTRQDKENHMVFSRQLNLEANFPEVIKLLKELETERGFSVSKLQLAVNPNNPKRHRVDFSLSCIKIKENFLGQLGLQSPVEPRQPTSIASLLLDTPWKSGQKLNLDSLLTDPFVKAKRKKPRPVRRRRAGKAKPLPPKDISGQYTMEGIVQIAGKRMTLIAPERILQEGDWLGDKQIVQIEKYKVFLQKGKRKYFLNLPNSIGLDDEIWIKEDQNNKPQDLTKLSVPSAGKSNASAR